MHRVPGVGAAESVSAAEISRFLSLLMEPGGVHEVRVPRYDRYGRTASGYFSTPEAAGEASVEWDGQANVYITLNPVDPALRARAAERIVARAGHATADSEIVHRRWLLLDIDATRPAGISSTHEELAAAREATEEAITFLTAQGWPHPLLIMSGNGFQVLYRVELANDATTLKLVQSVLRVVAQRCDTAAVHIDQGVANAARLAALVGTLKVKGDALPDRPHRRVRLEGQPGLLVPVSIERLEAVAALASAEGQGKNAQSRRQAPEKLADVLDRSGVGYRAQPPDTSGILWFGLEHCPFHSDGRPYECGVGEAPDARLTGKCFHPEGAGKGWRDFKAALGLGDEPGAGQRSAHVSATAEPDSVVGPFHRTDAGNGEYFARLAGDRLRYDHRRGRWLIWAEHWWRDDDTGLVRRLAKEAARQRYSAATAISELEERAKEAKFAIGTENRQRLDAMLLAAQSEPPIADAGDRWDADPWLFGVANGVVDLQTGALRPGSPADRITQHAQIAFDRAAACPRWERFLDEVFAANDELIDYLWRAVGYSLTGDVTEQCLWMCWGSGANGKSVFLAVLRALAGRYAANTPFSTFELHGRYAIPNDLAALAGKRIVTASETAEGARLNEERLKAFTGGEPISARFLNREFFDYRPAAKLWLAANHKPQVIDDSYGFWRRVRLIPFTRQFTVDADPRLLDQLRAELSGILAWAVRGALAWQTLGLQPPAAVASATATYRAESDPLADFLEARCQLGAEYTVGASAVYRDYRAWAADQSLADREALSVKAFGMRMTGRFEKRRSNGGVVYQGVGLLAHRADTPGWAAA